MYEVEGAAKGHVGLVGVQGCLAEQCRAAGGKPGAQLGVHQEGKLAPAALSASKLGCLAADVLLENLHSLLAPLVGLLFLWYYWY